MDEVKYYAMVVAMASRLPETTHADSLRAHALELLTDAVMVETRRRDRCRDTDIRAATRTRAW